MSRRLFTAPLLVVCGLGALAGTTPGAAASTGSAPASLASTAPTITPVENPNGKLMMLLDSSGSMSAKDSTGKPKIDAARSALHQVVNGLPSGARAGMRVFGATVKDKQSPSACTDSQLAVPLGTGNTAALNKAVDAYKPFGETPMAYAMQQAANDLGPSGQRSMILVSDGEDTCSPDPCKVAQQIADKGIDLKIDVVGFRVTGKAQKDLQCIAGVGRGSYYDADNAQDLTTSLKTLSTRAFRPFTVTGKPVAGTPIIDGAPTVTPGQWVSKIGETKDERYYQVKHTPGTTLHVSVAGRPGLQGDRNPSIGVSVRRTDGDSCYASDSTWGYDWSTTAMPIGAVARVDANDKDCGHVENLTIKVTTDSGGQPQETLGRDAMPFELRIVEEKPVTNVATLPAPAKDDYATPSDWTYALNGLPKTGGAGFSDAPTIAANTTFSGTLLPGEVQIYKVSVQYGQTLIGRANVAPPSLAMKSAITGSKQSLGVRISLFNPERESYNSYDSVTIGEYTDDRQDLARSIRPVTWRNREVGSSPSYLAGDYYIAIAAQNVPTGGAPINFLIRGDVSGTPTGQPQYAEPGTAQPTAPSTDDPTPSPTSSGTTSATSPSTAATEAGAPVAGGGDDGGLPMPLILGGGAGALALLGGGGAWIALRRKETQPDANGEYPTQSWQPPYGQG
ncbi:vWA domain-containing protein [Luteipulveratus mongoliensis]|uniref:VWFA domain-containing protein n=1 Tax=Luteipulveratus mongoliensis TaxID=571913 RepID=A0A0K1JDJ8_9MICO|nr:VWA domain-containing protein [Luteipulveratus mongoliensis]AKU14769.1 hypothetical protein VV02_00880 [Luteipulveratus mongoliensis]